MQWVQRGRLQAGKRTLSNDAEMHLARTVLTSVISMEKHGEGGFREKEVGTAVKYKRKGF